MRVRALTRLRDPNYVMVTDENGAPVIDPKSGKPELTREITELARDEEADLPDWQASRLIELGHVVAV